jgi:TPP-dependent pyruvate/acetoin dehydrogenase alpha subunit
LLTHRNIHYNIARCDSFAAEYHEYKLQPDGLAGGRLGSMNLNAPDAGVPYASSILGNNLPVAAGVALAARLSGDDSVTFVVTGDGAMEEGALYESLLFMKSAGLSAVVIVESNGWSLATEIEQRRCPIDLAALSGSLAIPYRSLCGADAVACAGGLAEVRQQALAENTPVVAEVPVKTLGFWYTPDDRFPVKGRFINYHHGASPSAKLSGWPVLEESDEDPVQVLRSYVDVTCLDEMARELRSELAGELA